MIFKLFHLATFVFVMCKLFEIAPVVAWSWWMVLAPSLIMWSIAIPLLLIASVMAYRAKPKYRWMK